MYFIQKKHILWPRLCSKHHFASLSAETPFCFTECRANSMPPHSGHAQYNKISKSRGSCSPSRTQGLWTGFCNRQYGSLSTKHSWPLKPGWVNIFTSQHYPFKIHNVEWQLEQRKFMLSTGTVFSCYLFLSWYKLLVVCISWQINNIAK